MTKAVALFRGQQLFQLHLHFIRILGVAQAEPVGNADAVGVGHHGRPPVDVARHEVGRLAPYAGQLDQLFHRVGNDAAELVAQHVRHGDDIPRLGLVQAAGADILAHFVRGGVGEGIQRRKPFKQGGRHHVDPRVGALGRQAGGDEQLQRIGIGQRADGVGVPLGKLLNGKKSAFFFSHITIHGLSQCRILSRPV